MKNQKSEADIWRDFVQTEVKSKSKLGKILESSQYGGYNKPELTIYFPDENSRKAAQGQTEAIKKKLREQYRLLCDRINFNSGSTTSTKIIIPYKLCIGLNLIFQKMMLVKGCQFSEKQ